MTPQVFVLKTDWPDPTGVGSAVSLKVVYEDHVGWVHLTAAQAQVTAAMLLMKAAEVEPELVR